MRLIFHHSNKVLFKHNLPSSGLDLLVTSVATIMHPQVFKNVFKARIIYQNMTNTDALSLVNSVSLVLFRQNKLFEKLNLQLRETVMVFAVLKGN